MPSRTPQPTSQQARPMPHLAFSDKYDPVIVEQLLQRHGHIGSVQWGKLAVEGINALTASDIARLVMAHKGSGIVAMDEVPADGVHILHVHELLPPRWQQRLVSLGRFFGHLPMHTIQVA